MNWMKKLGIDWDFNSIEDRMKNLDSKSHVRGESVYLDDVPLVQGTLFACVYDSPIAHGKLKNVDISEAEKADGRGENYYGERFDRRKSDRRHFAG